jgi:hypothetical protein
MSYTQKQIDEMIETHEKDKQNYINHIEETRARQIKILDVHERRPVDKLSVLEPVGNSYANVDRDVMWWCAGAAKILNALRSQIE